MSDILIDIRGAIVDGQNAEVKEDLRIAKEEMGRVQEIINAAGGPETRSRIGRQQGLPEGRAAENSVAERM